MGGAGGVVSTISAFDAVALATFPAASAVWTTMLKAPSGIADEMASDQRPDPSLVSCGLLPSEYVVPLTDTCRTTAPPGVPWSQVPVRTGWLLFVASELTVGAAGATVSTVSAFARALSETFPTASAV